MGRTSQWQPLRHNLLQPFRFLHRLRAESIRSRKPERQESKTHKGHHQEIRCRLLSRPKSIQSVANPQTCFRSLRVRMGVIPMRIIINMMGYSVVGLHLFQQSVIVLLRDKASVDSFDEVCLNCWFVVAVEVSFAVGESVFHLSFVGRCAV